MNNKIIPSDFLPIGFLGYLPYAAVPAGWLVCDGTVYNIADYPELAAKIGNTYGGDGVTTFAMPDDRGLFRRGLDLSKGYDVGRVLGSYENDAFQGHYHSIYWYQGASAGGSTYDPTNFNGTPVAYGAGSSHAGAPFSDGADGTPRTAAETRPKNRAYVPVIKAKNIYYDLSIQGGNAASLGGNPASYYAAASQVAKLTDFTGAFAANGYRKLPDGTILQWGSVAPAGGNAGVSFPIAFPVSCFIVTVGIGQNYGYRCVAQAYAWTTTGFNLAGVGNGDAYTSLTSNWFAVGK